MRLKLNVFLTLLLQFFLFVMPSQFLGETVPKERELKILVLIIASDNYNEMVVPIYTELQNIWRKYMHLDPEHFEAYFIKGDPNLLEPYRIEKDIIWARTEENVIPGILNKTVLSLEAFFPRINEFDFVLRTNLSSFFIFPKLLDCLQNLPRKKCYFGSNIGEDSFIASGSGFIISSDLVDLILRNKTQFIDNSTGDDVFFGIFLNDYNIPLIRAKRIDIQTFKEWEVYKRDIDSNVFHYRVKNPVDSLRLNANVHQEEIKIHEDMINIFYKK